MPIKNNKELISIALTTYNGEKYLSKLLNSIFSQTYKNIEVIVCDDLSQDSTVDILQEYSKKFNLKYFVNDNRLGVVKNFEKAISLCNGQFIALADQDDIWLPNKLEILYDTINRDEKILCVLSDAYVIDNNDKIISESFIKYIGVDKKTDFLSFLFGSRFPGCTFLIRKRLVTEALPFPDEVCHHDWWLNLVASKKGVVQYINDKLIYYRIHDSNVTGALKCSLKELVNFYIKNGKKIMTNHNLMLKAVLDRLYPDLSSFEKKVIYDLIKFNLKKDQYLSLKSFYIYLKHFKQFAPGKKLYIKLISMLSSLIGFKTIERALNIFKK